MAVSVSLAEAQNSVKQALTQLALLSLTGAVSSEDAAVILRLLSATTSPGGPTEGGLTLDKDQIKMRGTGRRPASMVGRKVVLTATWLVVRDHEDGRVTVKLVDSNADGRVRKGARKGGRKNRSPKA